MISILAPKHFRTKTNRVSTNSYSLFTFLPARLFKECTKSFNIFFLIMCCIVLIPGLTKFSKSAYILCVMMIISVNILKAAVHEIKKYTLDQKINTQKILSIRFRDVTEINREDINPGEKLIIPKEYLIPVDILLLGAYKEGSSESSIDEIYIETSALDGETSLKNRKTLMRLGQTGEISPIDIESLENIEANYNTEAQDGCISMKISKDKKHSIVQDRKIESNLKTTEETDGAFEISFTKSNIIPRNASIQTNCTVVGLSLGGRERPSEAIRVKGSLFMNMLSLLSVYTIIMYLVLLLVSSAGSCWFMINSEWLLGPVDYSILGGGIRSLFSNVIIFSSLIPLSLFVTLDGLRIAYSVFVQFDPEMAQDGVSPACNAHGVLEDIGMITHVLSDKTGTLTLNKMNFEGIYLAGDNAPIMFHSTEAEVDNQSAPSDSASDLLSAIDRNSSLLPILTILMCHSVDIVDNSYIGVSQEEVSMLDYIKQFGLEIVDRKDTFVVLSFMSNLVFCRILCILPFTPSMARMSIIVMIRGRVFILTKGSDEVVNCEGALEVGGEYRTLMMSGMEIKEPDIIKFATDYPESEEVINKIVQVIKDDMDKNSSSSATLSELLGSSQSSSLHEIKQTILAYSYTELPISFILYFETLSPYTGTLYIKDALQPRVESTIKSITEKNIRIWMLTGDRKESAISCGIAAGMRYNPNRVFSGANLIQTIQEDRGSVLIDESFNIVYRCSPEDKKCIARILRLSGNIVLSIGDGNNDVGMLEEADIGVGVYSTESNLAAFSADLVVPSFYGLGRLILTHGPVSLSRLKSVFMFFIFKSTCLAVCQCVYGVFVGASGSIASSSLFLLFFNSLITTPLSVEMGLFREMCLNRSVFFSFISGMVYGLGSFFVVYSATGSIDAFEIDGKLGGHSVVSCLFSLCLFISTIMYFIYSADSFVLYSFFALFVSGGFFVLSVGIEAGFRIFSAPFFYMCALYMLVVGMGIERMFCLIGRKNQNRLLQEMV